mgnify:CR=1 FL=1
MWNRGMRLVGAEAHYFGAAATFSITVGIIAFCFFLAAVSR